MHLDTFRIQFLVTTYILASRKLVHTLAGFLSVCVVNVGAERCSSYNLSFLSYVLGHC